MVQLGDGGGDAAEEGGLVPHCFTLQCWGNGVAAMVVVEEMRMFCLSDVARVQHEPVA